MSWWSCVVIIVLQYHIKLHDFIDFQAAVEEGIVVGGGCTLLRLASKVDAIKDSLDNDEEKVSLVLTT